MATKRVILTLAVVAAAGQGIEASATIINVPGDFGTIQAASADPGTVARDEIVVAPGTYNEAETMRCDRLGKKPLKFSIATRSISGTLATTGGLPPSGGAPRPRTSLFWYLTLPTLRDVAVCVEGLLFV
ncbi:MAG: hypothetical protein ACYS0D_08610 [Planctomycetota bacterium]|jgi:hypothetical protein